jgi:hypothetical protein
VLGKQKNKGTSHDDAIWDGTKDKDGKGPKPSKNQPAKVKDAFSKDYPNASGVTWSKYRGDWTATFSNGITKSTAVYHANGQRKDTRTVVSPSELPQVVETAVKKKRLRTISDVIKIETGGTKDIFRIKTVDAGSPRFSFYDADGKEVNYDY